MNSILKKLFAAADNHGESAGDTDCTVNDLQDVLRESWGIMSPSQKIRLLNTSTVDDLASSGGEFEPKELIDDLNKSLSEMEEKVTAAGYAIGQNESPINVFFWELNREFSEDFLEREDAVAGAFGHLVKTTKGGHW